jgi:exodeoxyribonuclease V alpha subunit
METLKGNITVVIHSSLDSDFKIVVFRTIRPDGTIGEEITAKGHIPKVSDRKDIYEMVGTRVVDPKYGMQFDVIDAERMLPDTPAGIQQFLADEVAGIGPARAARLVDHFGHNISVILSGEPERLIECPGISPSLVARITASWKEVGETSFKSTKLALASKGISRAYARMLIDHFGGQTVDILSNNPYRATEVDRIGFKIADEIAQKWGWPKVSPERTEAACAFVVKEATNSGHVFMHLDEFLNSMQHICKATEEEAIAALGKSVERGELIRDEVDTEHGKMVTIYLPYLHRAEIRLASRLAELQGYPHEIPPALDETLVRVQSSMHQELSAKQVEGVRNAFTSHVSGVTGGPGTGKTTLVKALVELAERLGLGCVLAAPTGRAAKRLSEVTGRAASTIHRLLEFDGDNYVFNRNRSCPIEADVLILDESSMLDLPLADSLFDAVPDHCSVVIIGDVDQLPAVGAGMVLRDLINSRILKFTVLDTIFRQAEGSLIIRNAHRIREGKVPQFPPRGTPVDCFFMDVPKVFDPQKGRKVDDIEFVKKSLARLCTHDIPTKLKIDPIKDIQVLVPMKVGDAGTHEFNRVLQDALNPEGSRITGTTFRRNDRVMQFKNNYKLDIFNGDIGFIDRYDGEEKVIYVDFYGRKVGYPIEKLEDLQLAYAQTIHKSQGSEYPVVIVVMMMQHYIMLERNLFYTATTRGKRMCLYLASRSAIELAPKNSKTQRNSLLNKRLRESIQLEVV